MNERIKELAEQAGLKVNADGEIGPAYFGSVDAGYKKFAELIVKECCQYLGNEAERLFGLSESEEDPVFQSNFEICAEKCYDNIQGLKEHFGVEE
jgi:hypothetical protein